ncbi:unnamed protein product [Adineta ricciae]|uniref:ADP ribosyltransferase domain-containing protein n=1 Tax=Adineta ricciae TaxID=249248 RepID=A0A815E3S1_ADIRI|nr:unnamed protein product [Adineta ricciae]
MSYRNPTTSKQSTTRSNRNLLAKRQYEGVSTPRDPNAGHTPIAIIEANRRFKDGINKKEVIPPIPPSRTNLDNNYDDINGNTAYLDTADEDSLPLKLFDGKKQSLSELSEEFMSYLWFRRIKEIFLHMDSGRDGQDEDPFIEFDMNLARIDLMNACDRYIENERIIVTKKDGNMTKSNNNSQQSNPSLSIDECINALHNLVANPSSEELSAMLNKCIGSLRDLDKRTQDVIAKIEKQRQNNSKVNIHTIVELIQSLTSKERKSDLEKKQEWDMKKLYAEVFKMSYKRNRLRTENEQEELTPVKKGDDQPNFGNAIWWYSCDKASIYYQINSILRLENFELLVAYRYYLSDLCRMIEYMYEERKREQSDSQVFYRAGHVNEGQLEKMRKSQKGHLISLGGFISATTNMNIAKGYAKKQNISKSNKRVLFQITVKPQEPCTAFAYINGISFHPEEEEVLFSMGSAFTVDRIVDPEDGENYYTVQLTASDIDKTLANDIRTKVEECSPSGRAALLAHYLMELGEYRAARKYLTSLLNEARDGGILINDPNLATIYSCLGMIYARQALHGDALKAFKQALNTQARLEYSNNNALAEIHRNIGLAYVGLGRMNEAEQTLAKALRIKLREVNSDEQHLASIYGDIGYVQYKKNNFKNASDAFEKAEKIYKTSSNKIAHDELEQCLNKAEYLTNYGHLLSVKKSLTEAQTRYNEALKLYKSVLRNYDPKLMQTHINIMIAYAKNEKFNDATRWFEDTTVQTLINNQEMNVFELNSSVTQSSLAFLHEFIGACYMELEAYYKAIRLWARAVIFKRKARLEQLLLDTTSNISSTLNDEQKQFINKNYRAARDFPNTNSRDKDQSADEKKIQIPHEFCVGLLCIESYDDLSAIENLRKVAIGSDVSDSDTKLVACLLLAELYKQQSDFNLAIDNCDQALQLVKQSKNQKDRVLEIEVSLTRIECISKIRTNTNAIDELIKLDRSLRTDGSDTKYVTLKVIVYDTLARYYLSEQNYSEFDVVAERSVTYKIRNFSQYHPSLAINSKLLADRYCQQSRYHEALYFYERALEVQSLNLTVDHPQNRKIFYAMGNVYCKIDKLSNAKEKYDIAENMNSNKDEDDVLIQDKINAEESMDILMAQISMHQHLASLYTKKKDYAQAISETNKILELLKEELPSAAFDTDNENPLMKKKIDSPTLVKNLRLLAKCYLRSGDILGIAQDDEMGYEVASNIYKKLNNHDKKLGNHEIVLLLKKLSQYHEDTFNREKALTCLKDIINFEKPSSTILYRLGSLSIACDGYDEAVKTFKDLLNDPVINAKPEQKQIVEENLKEAQSKLENLKLTSNQLLSDDSSDDDDDTSSNSSNDLPRHDTNISTPTKQHIEIESEKTSDDESDTMSNHKEMLIEDATAVPNSDKEEMKSDPEKNVENTDKSSDDRAKALAYFELEDLHKSLKYHQRYIKSQNKSVSMSEVFQTQLSKIQQDMFTFEQRSLLCFLPKLLHSLVTKIREESLENSDVLLIADSHFQCGILNDKLSSHLQSSLSYISAFQLYFSKSTGEINELTNLMREILNTFIDGKLVPKMIIDFAQKIAVASDDIILMRLKLAAMYRDNETDDVTDEDDDGDISVESRMIALKWYRDCLTVANDVLTKATCYYNVLCLYRDYIHEDDAGRNDVKNLVKLLPELSILDRHLLLNLAHRFVREYDDNKGVCDKYLNAQLQKLLKKSFDEMLEVSDELSVGDKLVECEDLDSAEEYWNSVVEQLTYDKFSMPLNIQKAT